MRFKCTRKKVRHTAACAAKRASDNCTQAKLKFNSKDRKTSTPSERSHISRVRTYSQGKEVSPEKIMSCEEYSTPEGTISREGTVSSSCEGTNPGKEPACREETVSREGCEETREESVLRKASIETQPCNEPTKCEHEIQSRQKFTHLPVESQESFIARHSKEDVTECSECAILENMVANKCEKCLHTQELASFTPTPKSSRAPSKRCSPIKKRAPLPASLPRTKTEAELIKCPPVRRNPLAPRTLPFSTNPPARKNLSASRSSSSVKKQADDERNLCEEAPTSGLAKHRPSTELFKKAKPRKYLEGANVYVIQPTFEQCVRPLVCQSTKEVQTDNVERSWIGKNALSCQDEPKLVNTSSASHYSESSSGEEDLSTQNSKSERKGQQRQRGVMIQCKMPQKCSRPRPKGRSKSASPSKIKVDDDSKSGVSEVFIGPSTSDTSRKRGDSQTSTQENPVNSNTQIVIEEKIYVKGTPEAIRKKIITGDRSIFSGKSLASSIRALLSGNQEESLVERNNKSIDEPALNKSPPAVRNCSSPSEAPIKKSTSHETTSNKNKYATPVGISCAQLSQSEPLNEESSCVLQNKDQCSSRSSRKYFDGRFSPPSRRDSLTTGQDSEFDRCHLPEDKCVYFDEMSIASYKQGVLLDRYSEKDSVYETGSDYHKNSKRCRGRFLEDKVSKRSTDCSKSPDISRKYRQYTCEKDICDSSCDNDSADEKKFDCHTPLYHRNRRRCEDRSPGRNVSKQSNDCSKLPKNRCACRRCSVVWENEVCKQPNVKSCGSPRRKSDRRRRYDSYEHRHETDVCSPVFLNDVTGRSCTENSDSQSCSDVSFITYQSSYATKSCKPYEKACRSRETDVEACHLTSATTSCPSRSSVFYRDTSSITCVFFMLIIFIVLFFIGMLVWRLMRDDKTRKLEVEE
nr:PREDICTED: uncharacterized protein LOC109035457 [Bemisia tabaci]